MVYTQLGTSSLRVSRIGFGCMSLKPGNAANEALLQEALDAGINYFDTADLYDKGENETLLGRAFRGKREAVIIATKAGNQWKSDGSGWECNPRRDYILKAVDASLQRLQRDYIDLYQLHGGTIDDPIDETIGAFEDLVKAGKIRYYGISSIRPNVIREWAGRSNLVSVMMQYSLLDRRAEETVLPLLQEKKISVVARGTVAQGLLVNKTPKAYLGHSDSDVQSAQMQMRAVAGKETSATPIRFALAQTGIAAAVVGIRTTTHLREALDAAETAPFSDAELDRLARSVPKFSYADHR